MAGVKILEGAPINTPLAQLSEKERDVYARMRASDAIHALHADCRPLAKLIEEAEEVGWMGEANRDGFIVNVLKKPVRTIDLALEGLQWFDLSRPVKLDDAVERGRSASERIHAAAMRSDGNVLPNDGSVHPGNASQFSYLAQADRAEEAGVSVATQKKLDALARRAPELLDEVRAGRMSTHAAAKKAGIVREKPPIEHLRTWWRKASEDERVAFRDEIDTPVMDARFG